MEEAWLSHRRNTSKVFRHAKLGEVDAFVMHRFL